MQVMPTQIRLIENDNYKLELQSTQEIKPEDGQWNKTCLYRVIFPGNKECFVLYPEHLAENKNYEDIPAVVGQAACQLAKGKENFYEVCKRLKENYILCEKVPVGMQGWGGQTF